MIRFAALVLVLCFSTLPAWAETSDRDKRYIRYWSQSWPATDFSKSAIDFGTIMDGGPPRDGIPPIDQPIFKTVSEMTEMDPRDPVIGVIINGEAKAYPLSVLMWHEIANDTLGGVPITVTFCPLCNAAIVFDRRLDGRVFDFGTTGKLRNSDLVMWDRQTESWWQQFLGQGIIGEMTGKRLTIIPSRLESWANFKARAPEGQVLVPTGQHRRAYGSNPYQHYDSNARPFLYRGDLPPEVPPLMRVVTLGEEGAWSFALLQQKKEVVLADGRTIRWTPGQASALDETVIVDSRDVGNVTVTRMEDGKEVDVVHGVDFAFAYFAFYPDSPIHHVE